MSRVVCSVAYDCAANMMWHSRLFRPRTAFASAQGPLVCLCAALWSSRWSHASGALCAQVLERSTAAHAQALHSGSTVERLRAGGSASLRSQLAFRGRSGAERKHRLPWSRCCVWMLPTTCLGTYGARQPLCLESFIRGMPPLIQQRSPCRSVALHGRCKVQSARRIVVPTVMCPRRL